MRLSACGIIGLSVLSRFGRSEADLSTWLTVWRNQDTHESTEPIMELMVIAGSAILERLAAFDRDLNLPKEDFGFRLGVHTGVSLVDLDAGIAYSQVLDPAGHIQKIVEPDTLVVSQMTLDSLPKSVPVTPVAEMMGEAGQLYRIDRFLHRSDLETT